MECCSNPQDFIKIHYDVQFISLEIPIQLKQRDISKHCIPLTKKTPAFQQILSSRTADETTKFIGEDELMFLCRNGSEIATLNSMKKS